MPTNRDCLVAVLESDGFANAETSTDFLGQHLELVGAHTPADVERLQTLATSLTIRRRRRDEAVVLGSCQETGAICQPFGLAQNSPLLASQ